MFTIIEDSIVILRANGVFTQTQAYAYNGQVFAKKGSGFVKLMKYRNGTTHPATTWVEVTLPADVLAEYDSTGVMVIKNG